MKRRSKLRTKLKRMAELLHTPGPADDPDKFKPEYDRLMDEVSHMAFPLVDDLVAAGLLSVIVQDEYQLYLNKDNDWIHCHIGGITQKEGLILHTCHVCDSGLFPCEESA